MQRVDVEDRSLSSYRGIASEQMLAAVTAAAEPLRGARMLHLNATPYGGGVAELLRSVVPVLTSLGVDAEWRVMAADDSFFGMTKALHNGLQGGRFTISDEALPAYEETCARNAGQLDGAYDLVVVHDPQPAGVQRLRSEGNGRWIWRCHIDTSEPDPQAWAFLQPFLGGYDAAIFTSADYLRPDLPIPHVEVIPPAIDPLSPKNAELARAAATRIVSRLGIDPEAPLVSQVSRFDPWKDPAGVVEAYRLARAQIPALQLVLAGSMAADDPEATGVYEELRAAGDSDPAIHLLTDLSDIEINALQRCSLICVQKSLREGFGLVVSEAIWKGTPVIASRTGGIPLQMADGAGGRLVDDIDACARAIVELLTDPALARELAASGRERVREHFLLPRLILNELLLLGATADGNGRPACATTSLRDPFCGIAMCTHDDRETAERPAFCSEDCRTRFFSASHGNAIPDRASH
jgi:trehalose synthase